VDINEKEVLIDWLNLFSVRKGEKFELASGQITDVYVDVKKTAQHNRCYRLLARLLSEKIVQQFAPIEAVAGVVLGGCHLASIVAMQYPVDLDVISVRKEAKNHGTKNLIERPTMFKYQEIILLEDVITTGNSATEAARLLEKEGFHVKGILAVVDRRPIKKPYLNNYKFVSLVDFEELTP
jgi:orotate phosphoribosyltransferase